MAANAELKREWTAKDSTFLKSSQTHSDHLLDHDKKKVEKGQKLEALLVSETGAYWRIRDARLDGASLEPHIEFVYKYHWQLNPAMQPISLAEEVQQPVLAATPHQVLSSPLPTTVPMPRPEAALLPPTPILQEMSPHVSKRRISALFKRATAKRPK